MQHCHLWIRHAPPSVYSPSRWCPCASRRSRRDAPVIWRKLLPADSASCRLFQRNGLLDHLQTCGVSHLFYFYGGGNICIAFRERVGMVDFRFLDIARTRADKYTTEEPPQFACCGIRIRRQCGKKANVGLFVFDCKTVQIPRDCTCQRECRTRPA